MRAILSWAVVVVLCLGLVGVASAAAPPARLHAEDNEFKDILLMVQQSGGGLGPRVAVNSDSGLTGTIILNERNFDITGLPTIFEDVVSGAFRGAGQELRMESVPGTEGQRR